MLGSANAFIMKRLLILTVGLCLSAGLFAQQSDIATKIDEYAQQVMKTWQLPGFAMAVSVDNKVIFKKGYGVKELRPANGVGFQGVRFDECKMTQAGVKPVVNNPGDD